MAGEMPGRRTLYGRPWSGSTEKLGCPQKAGLDAIAWFTGVAMDRADSFGRRRPRNICGEHLKVREFAGRLLGASTDGEDTSKKDEHRP